MVCGADGAWVCSKCWNKIGLINTPICYRCGRLSSDFQVCQNCRRNSSIKRFIVCGYWQEPLKSLIYNLKYRRLHILAEGLGKLLAMPCIKFNNRDMMVLVPIPLHYGRLWNRGFNQAQLLAKVVSRLLGIDLVIPLTRVRCTAPQFSLSKGLRKDNVKDAFVLKSGRRGMIENKIVILVDDVVATGSTIEECARILKQDGAKEIWALVLARA